MNLHVSTTATTRATSAVPRHDWTLDDVRGLLDMPFNDLVHLAQTVHRVHFDANRMQLSTLLSIKTGGCSEDCAYCAQSAHHESGVEAGKLMDVDEVVAEARRARDGGADRYCMGAAWRELKDRDLDGICAMVEGVRDLGMETCMTLGMLTEAQVARLKEAGLDYYNHNLDTSEEFYGEIVTTRTYRDRLDTLARVRDAGINVCCGGIVGMGESRDDRARLLQTLANLPKHPESVPINMLVQVEGTPLHGDDRVSGLDFVRTVAAARVMMPASMVRLSAGREQMSDELQALCFLAGANSIFVGPRLLTTKNPEKDRDYRLLRALGIEPMAATDSGE